MDDDSQKFTIFLVHHALVVKLPLKKCKPIPENIIAPKEVLSKRLEICTGPLSELELYLLTDSSLKITLQTPAFRLHLHKDMKIFKRISYPDTRNGSHSDDWVWTFNEFRVNFATKEMKNELESDADFRVIQLKKKLAEAKIKGKTNFEEEERPAKAS